MKMKKMSGDVLIKKCRELPFLQSTLFVLMTGGLVEDALVRSVTQNRDAADAVLFKPFRRHDIAELLGKILKGAR